MEMMKKFSVEELNAMRSYIRAYGEEGGDSLDVTTDSINIEHILRFWAQEKLNLFRAFGEELILTKHFSYKKSEVEMEEDFQEHLFGCGSEGETFSRAFHRWLDRKFWDDNRENYYNLRNLLNTNTLMSNVYAGPTVEIELSNGKKLVVNSGCKASKILGKIASSFSIEGYEEFRVAHSMCLNQKTMEGDVCLSIHPLDYMTMSDNDCSWSSCMSWQEGGDYRQGTVEMMNSPYVVVAYLKSKDDMNLFNYYGDNFMWNSKKWRQLYIVEQNVVMGIKQYPYENDDLSTFCLRWLRDLAENVQGYGPYHPQMCRLRNRYDNYLAFLDKTVSFHFETCFMYNDCYGDHDAFVSVDTPTSVYIMYSGESECMRCGAVITDAPDDLPTHTLLCSDCGRFMHCDECGCAVNEDTYYWVDDTRLCESCYENYASNCNWCEESHFTDNMTRVFLKHKDQIIAGYNVVICNECMNSSRFKKEVGTVEFDDRSYRYYISSEILTETGWEFFEVDEEDRDGYLADLQGSEQE